MWLIHCTLDNPEYIRRLEGSKVSFGVKDINYLARPLIENSRLTKTLEEGTLQYQIRLPIAFVEGLPLNDE